VISLQKINSRILTRQSGVSIVELMVAMLLGLILLFALIEILINGKESFSSANHMSRLQENGRIATNLMITDLKRAGYMGGNSDVPNIFGTTGKLPPAVSCATGNNNWGRMIEQPLVGLNDSNAGYACIANGTYLRGDVVAVRYASPWVATAPFTANRPYLRSSLFEGKIFVGNAQGNAFNTVLDQPQSVRELQAYAYFVGDSGRTCSGVQVPSLFRVRLDDNGQPLTEELLPGVDNLQVQYGVGGRYVDADAVANWDAVVTARIWLLVRSECAEIGFSDVRTYTMGDQVIVPNDNFRRQLYSSVVMIRN
jgi:type IV pilus assembly protein PilW